MKLEVQIIRSLASLNPEAWNTLVPDHEPFSEHAFLLGLEQSQSVGTEESGWFPMHLWVTNGPQPIAALPLYAKTNSYGEYIFDWGWAHASEQAGIPYYPKLVSAIPFTPASGARLLLEAHLDAEQKYQVFEVIIETLRKLEQANGCSSTHILFLNPEEKELWCTKDYAPRSSFQFHWRHQKDWNHFDDYLQSMRHASRKQVKRERRQAQEHKLRIEIKKGTELNPNEWDALWHFYQNTCAYKRAIPYLRREFFNYLRQSFAHRVLVSLASSHEGPEAGALMFTKGQHLYGRYWGALQELKSMHFELCYYAPIEWCLRNGITLFEAGAQGAHKLKRGFLPAECHSAHHIAHEGLAQAIERFLPNEALQVHQTIDVYSEHSPFRSKE